MLITHRVLAITAFLTVLVLPAGCTQDDPETPWDEGATPETSINVDDIAGEAGTVIYNGQEQSGTIRVPANALIGVAVDGRGFLYHPALGRGVELSDDTSRKALACFVFGLDDVDPAAPGGRVAASDEAPVVTLGPGDATLNATGLSISRSRVKNGKNHILNVHNRFNRWAGLQLPDGTAKMIPSAGRLFDANTCRWLASSPFKFLVDPIWPEEGAYAHFASTDAAIFETAAVGDVHIVGATWRAQPYNWFSGGSPPYLADAQRLGKFYELVNIMDMYYVFLEGIKHIGGAMITMECVDVAFGVWANYLESNSLAIASGDASVREHFYQVLKEDFYNSLINCAGVVATQGFWEVFQTLVDLFALFDWFVEDIYLNAPFVYNLPAYGKVRLASDNPCDAAADITIRVGDAEFQGSKPGSQWCRSSLYVTNNSADKNIYVIYTVDGETWDFKRGLMTLPDDITAGYEQGITGAYSYEWPHDGTCQEQGIKSIAAFYKSDLLSSACKDEYDYVLENKALPPGISATSVVDGDPCRCP
jgi:hypothetical protein